MSVLIVRSVNHISITTSPRHLDTVVSLSHTHTHTWGQSLCFERN